MLKTNPAVFAVNKNYQIFVPVEEECLLWVTVNGENYYDASNGIMRSATLVHKVDIPQDVLNNAGEYTVCLRPVIKRKAYNSDVGELESYTFKFFPVPENNIKAYNISDAHSRVSEPIAAAKAYGQIDLLILCGDILDDCSNEESFLNVYKICSEITKGNIPIVSARGNHDMRGALAEKFSEYMPSANGDIFFTFNLGSLWGVVLDCGEITDDSDPAHSFTVCCNPFRHKQTEFLKSVVANADNEYNSKNVKNRIVVVHDPFFERHTPPYDVTRDIFKEWFELINNNMNPDFWLCGHSHLCQIRNPGYSVDEFGINSPLVMASTPGDKYFKGGAIEFNSDEITITFTDSNGDFSDNIKL